MSSQCFGECRLFAIPLLFLLSGCSGESAQSNDANIAASENGLGVTTAYDRPAAALIERVVNGTRELWTFACGADNVMRRRVFNPSTGWGSWFVVANSFPCASAPSAGKWIGGTPSEALGVYYRGTNGGLVEARYSSDGTKFAKDVTLELGFRGTIVGNPVVVDAVDVPGMTQRISVAAKRAQDNSLITFDFFQGGWQIHNMTDASGRFAHAPPATDFGVSYGQYKKNYVAVQTDASEYTIYTRKSWNAGYGYYASITDPDFTGVMNFGLAPLSDLTGDVWTVCLDYGCITVRSGDRLFWWQMDPNSNLQDYLSEPGGGVGGSAYATPTGPTTDEIFGRAKNGGLLLYGVATQPVVVSGSLSSAPSPVTNGKTYWKNAVYTKLESGHHRLYYCDRNGLNDFFPPYIHETPLDYPGDGVLAP